MQPRGNKRLTHATGSRHALADGKHSGMNSIRSATGRTEPREKQDPWPNATTKSVVFEAKYVKRVVCVGCSRAARGRNYVHPLAISRSRRVISSTIGSTLTAVCPLTTAAPSIFLYLFLSLLFPPIDHRLWPLVRSANRALDVCGVPLQCREKQGKPAVQARVAEGKKRTKVCKIIDLNFKYTCGLEATYRYVRSQIRIF